MDSHAEISEYLELAWKHLGLSSGDLDLPDVIDRADIQFAWPQYRDELVSAIIARRYHPTHVKVVDLPKDRVAVRPLARLDPQSRLTYEASVFAIASKIESSIPNCVYSYRWWKRKGRLLSAKGSWIRMQRIARNLHRREPELLLAKTDITAFYECIEPDILIADLRKLRATEWAVDVLDGFLKAFNGLNGVWGIPQGSDASGILANFYLVSIDHMIKKKFRHFRYSDDIYIFGEDWLALRQVMLDANTRLRRRRLHLSSNKTKIISGEDIAAEFEDMEKNAISYGVAIETPGARDEVRAYFDRVVAGAHDPRPRDLKYCLTQFTRLSDDYAVKWILENMDEIPNVARESLIYLRAVAGEDSEIGAVVIGLIANSKLTIYPYAQQHLLIHMILADIRGDAAINAAQNLLHDKNSENYVREFAARYLGLKSDPLSFVDLRQEFEQETDDGVRRALLIACYESNQCPDVWLQTIADSYPALSLTATYLSSRPRSIPLPVVWREFEE